MKPIILVDQDNVLADFERGFHDAWMASMHLHPEVPPIPLEARRTFRIVDDYPEDYREMVLGLQRTPGFFAGLPSVPGAIEAIKQLEAQYEIVICTSPLTDCRNGITEKLEWIERHFGAEYVLRTIVTKDKTLVHGDWLIDDNPEVTGLRTPVWRHLIFDQPYNRQIRRDRVRWNNSLIDRLREVL